MTHLDPTLPDRDPEAPVLTDAIRAVSFDAGGTLLAPWPSVGTVYAQVAAAYDLPGLSPARLDKAFRSVWQTIPDFDYSRDAWNRLIRATFAEVISERLPEALCDALYERFRRPDVWRVYEDVIPTLNALTSTGKRLAVISNWDDRLAPLLEALNLAQYFDSLSISWDHGAAKPSPDLFRAAVDALGVSPENILHVGDSENEDYLGATHAGLKAVLLKRQKTVSPKEMLTIRSLQDLTF